ncbi:MAG: HPF/RaiA family ribosome-associated protein [Bacteroidales bacterium]|nr:HPF/RaiA family ribosome-associated protein [Bacteroidales bacterium]
MDIQIHSLKFNADKKLLDFIQAKMQKLAQLNESMIRAEVFLRLDKSNVQANKITEIKVEMPRTSLFAKKQCKSFEEATDQAIDALKKQITRQKEKIRKV